MLRIALLFMLATCLALSATPSSAASIKSQRSCGTGSTPCVTFNSTQSIPSSVRRFAFDAPRAGAALVEFHGSMRCTNGPNKIGANLVSGISKSAAAVPSENSPGGLAHSFVFPPQGEITFNLASSHVFPIASAGKTVFHFNLTGMLGNGIQCEIFNAAFRVMFVRAPNL